MSTRGVGGEGFQFYMQYLGRRILLDTGYLDII